MAYPSRFMACSHCFTSVYRPLFAPTTKSAAHLSSRQAARRPIHPSPLEPTDCLPVLDWGSSHLLLCRMQRLPPGLHTAALGAPSPPLILVPDHSTVAPLGPAVALRAHTTMEPRPAPLMPLSPSHSLRSPGFSGVPRCRRLSGSRSSRTFMVRPGQLASDRLAIAKALHPPHTLHR